MCVTHDCFKDLTCAIGCLGGSLGGGGGGSSSGGGGSSSGGGFGLGDGGIPLTCIVDCLATGCASAQAFAQAAVTCLLDNIGTCGGFNLNCLMSACMGPIAACLNDTCTGG
jgi:hypothetical protein